MKKIVLYLFLVGALLLFSSQHVLADATVTRVRGNIYDQNNGGVGVPGLTVTVTCNGITKTDATDSSGLYFVDYTHEQCPQFVPVTATVTFNGETQTQTVNVAHVFRATLDFYFGSIGVPEFGAVTGIVAAIGSGIAYWNLRKRVLT